MTVTLTIRSKMLTLLTIDEILLSFSGGKLLKKIVHPIGCVESEELENIRSISEKGPVRPQGHKGFSPPSKSRGQGKCCNHYCSSYMGALSGNRIVTTHTDSTGSEVSYACLSIPPLQAVTYSFPLNTYEAVLTTLPASDLSVCLETVKMTLRTHLSTSQPNVSPIHPLPSPVPSPSLFTSPLGISGSFDESNILPLVPPNDVTDTSDLFREIILEISPLSTAFRKAIVDRNVKKDDKTAVKPTAGIILECNMLFMLYAISRKLPQSISMLCGHLDLLSFSLSLSLSLSLSNVWLNDQKMWAAEAIKVRNDKLTTLSVVYGQLSEASRCDIEDDAGWAEYFRSRILVIK